MVYVKETLNPFEIAQAQLDMAAYILGLDEATHQFLDNVYTHMAENKEIRYECKHVYKNARNDNRRKITLDSSYLSKRN